MHDNSARLYPADGFLPPVERKPQTKGNRTLPASVKVYSADNHISVAEDIWYEGFPAQMKDRAPRVWFEDGIFKIGFNGQSMIPPAFIPGLYDIEHYWRNNMYSSFLFDSLGLELLNRIGADRVMWSSDYPHNEGSFGLSRSSLELVMDAVDPDIVPQVVGGNLIRYLNVQR